MAVTKIHPIKSTLKKALDYIENPVKPDEKILVSSFACSYETADIEFELLLSQAMQKGNNLAHHLIQSFAPGETTPEQAHEIGRQLADEVLQGKYPYVLTTHIDKGHVHNHIIFCAVDMVNQRKYVSNRQSYAYIRRTSDRLCKEHGLSVVMPGQDRGKSYAEWDAHRKGTSWKAKLKAAIDAAIPQAKDFDDFLRLLQEQGYEVKRGKYVSFRAPGQERFTRCKTLGEAYTEEAITERIKGLFVERKPKENRKISLRIDLENSIKVQQFAGYEKWAKLHNLKQAARTLNFLTEHEIESYPDLESRVAEITAASTEAAAALKVAERRLAEMAVLIKDVTTCKELHPLLQEYQRAADKKQFRRKHEGTLILYEAAAKALKEQGFQKPPDLYALKTEYKQLAEQKDQLQRQYAEAKRQMQEYGICTDTRIGLDQLAHLRFNFGHELVRVCIALGNLGQAIFPFGGQDGRGQAFRQNHRQIDAVLGGDKLFALALHKAHLHQLFQNRRTGGRSTQPLAFRMAQATLSCSCGAIHLVLRHILGPGPLHC